MTIIATYPDSKGRIYMAGDRRVSNGDTTQYYTCPRPKIAKRGKFLVGAAGHSSGCGYLVDHFPFPKQKKRESDIKFVELTLKTKLRDWLLKEKLVKIKGIARKDDGVDLYVSALIVYAGKVYALDIMDDTVLIEQVPIINSIGCGHKNAMTIFQQLGGEESNLEVTQLLQLGVKAAADYSWGCDDNIDIIAE